MVTPSAFYVWVAEDQRLHQASDLTTDSKTPMSLSRKSGGSSVVGRALLAHGSKSYTVLGLQDPAPSTYLIRTREFQKHTALALQAQTLPTSPRTTHGYQEQAPQPLVHSSNDPSCEIGWTIEQQSPCSKIEETSRVITRSKPPWCWIPNASVLFYFPRDREDPGYNTCMLLPQIPQLPCHPEDNSGLHRHAYTSYSS